MGDRR